MTLDKFLEFLSITGLIFRRAEESDLNYTVPWKKEFDSRLKDVRRIMEEEFKVSSPEVLKMESEEFNARAHEFQLGPRSIVAFSELQSWCEQQELPAKH